ncbi:hypothetical protein EVAR_63876_1 [Eumeta japonica]|uniref:Uncharacterized protein n=1 Tax=Eumeta variegata TaxID=151549 RepID=A0A4C2A2I2_EUMVA|nr:hypothetical protein EVAR_63876_1 [Eumeta japonica]
MRCSNYKSTERRRRLRPHRIFISARARPPRCLRPPAANYATGELFEREGPCRAGSGRSIVPERREGFIRNEITRFRSPSVFYSDPCAALDDDFFILDSDRDPAFDSDSGLDLRFRFHSIRSRSCFKFRS